MRLYKKTSYLRRIPWIWVWQVLQFNNNWLHNACVIREIWEPGSINARIWILVPLGPKVLTLAVAKSCTFGTNTSIQGSCLMSRLNVIRNDNVATVWAWRVCDRGYLITRWWITQAHKKVVCHRTLTIISLCILTCSTRIHCPFDPFILWFCANYCKWLKLRKNAEICGKLI